APSTLTSLPTRRSSDLYKEDPSRRRTFGMPDNIVVEDGRITIVEEAKMWSKRDFERLAQLAKENPNDFIRKGIVPKGGDKRQIRSEEHTSELQSRENLV